MACLDRKQAKLEFKMIISRVECFPLRIPLKPTKSDASAWGDKDSPAANSLLVKVTTGQGCEPKWCN